MRRHALAIFQSALKAADAAESVRRHLCIRKTVVTAAGLRLPLSAFDRIFLIAAGKAAVPMARAVEQIFGPLLDAGMVITKKGHGGDLNRCSLHETGHPVPDLLGNRASRHVRELLKTLNARDLLLVAISGGASALLPAPPRSITLAEKQRVTNLLLRAGADIFELNAVRKHLSDLKGGRFAALAYPATVVSLILSDVIGDRLDVIGSGLTAPDPTTFHDALAVLNKYRLLARVPDKIRLHLERGAGGELPETPKPGDPLFENVHNVIVGSNRQALQAAAKTAKALGYRALVLSSTLQGETRDVARVHAEILREATKTGHPVAPPACILSGGETTVTVRGSGKGGRNQEFALASAIAISGLEDVLVLSAGTDGTDGPTDAAGAIATGDTLNHARKLGLDPRAALVNHNSYPLFTALGDLVHTGPTGTNVMDIHILLAGAR